MKTKQAVKNTTVKQKHQCTVCLKTVLGSSYKFKSHLYQHKVVKSRFKCPYCIKEYYRRDVYDKHVAVHKGNRKYHTCDYCDRGFVDKRNLVSHLKIHDEYFTKQQMQYKCIACGASYCEERLLKYHIRKQHFNLHAKDKKASIDRKKPNETWVERVMHSEICVEMTKIDDNKITIKRSPTTKEVVPDKVDEKSQFQEYMSSVFANTDNSQYSKAVCDYCKKEMLKKSLQPHIRERHLKLKRFKCNQCKVHFSRHYQMVNHICGKYKPKKRK